MSRLILFAALVLLSQSALCADLHDPENTFSDLLELVRNSANQWSARLYGFAVFIFWSLVSIQLVWTFGPMLVRRAELGEFLSELVMFVVRTTIFFAMLKYSVEWGQMIIDSFRHAGATAAGMPAMLQPGDMFTLAVSLANTVSNVDTWNPAVGILIMISAFMILLCFTYIAAHMAVTLIKSYVVINAAMIFLGFGGANITREYAMNWIKYAFSVGAELFVLTLIVGMIMSASKDWQASYTHDSTSTLVLAGMAFLCAILTKTIPEQIQSLIAGASTGNGSVLGGMAVAGMTLGAAAAATISTKLAASGIMGGGVPGSGGGIASMIGSSLSGGGSPASSAMSSMSSPSSGGMGGASPIGSGSSGFSSPSGGSGQSTRAKMAHAAHATTAGAVRTAGTLASISVPGMEGAENTSIGMSPYATPPSFPNSPAPEQETPENLIRPDESGDEK